MIKALTLAVLLAVASWPLCSPAAAAQSVRAGIEAWQRSDYAGALAIWRPLAERGDADAAFNIAQAYRLGRGVETDIALAEGWLVKAAVAGHLEAQATLSLLLFDSGRRGPALQWLALAAVRGEPRAMLVYGTALFNGDGVPRNPELAHSYVSRAAEQGFEPAKAVLAELNRLRAAEQQAPPPAVETTKAPEPPAAPAPTERPAPDAGKWRIQLGAFSSKSGAEALYRRLSGSPELAGRKPYYVSARAIVRLQVGPFANRAGAEKACAALSRKGQACFALEAN